MRPRRSTIPLAALALAALLAAAAPAPAAGQARARVAPPSKTIVVLVGMPGSGKTTVASALAARLGAPRWTSGDVIRRTIAERGLPYNAENDRKVAEEFGRRPGEIGRRIAGEIARAPGPVAIVEGFRTTADLAALRAAFPDAKVVSIEVGARRRHDRMLLRGRAGEDSRAYLRDRDRAEIRRGVRDVMRAADHRVRPRGDGAEAAERTAERIRALIER